MSNITELANIPDVSFIDNLTLQQVRDQIISDYTAAYTEEQGKAPDIHPGTPERLMLYAFADHFYQALQYVDRAGKMGLLKYSEGDWLDNIATLRGITRRAATPATATVMFTLSDIRNSATGIPAGTRVAAAGVYFATNTYLLIDAGDQTGTVSVTAIDAGEIANGIPAGDINTMVDVVPYVASVTSTTASSGGTERESDDALTERVFAANRGYSVAGPIEAYAYHAKQALPNIGDVQVYSPSAGEVNVVFLMADGSLPNAEQRSAVQQYLSDSKIRPLTDSVSVSSPTEETYAITVVYYINKADKARENEIQANVAKAIEDYKAWQRKIGRDINPSKLTQLIMEAGAKRVVVGTPAAKTIPEYTVSKNRLPQIVTYGGLEDD